MPNPTPSDVHVDRTLTNLSVAYAQDASKFVHAQVFPEVPSAKQSDLYRIYDKETWHRILAEKRAPGTESAGGGYKLSTTPFYCERYALHDDVDDPTLANADDELAPIEDSTLYVTENMLMRREFDWASQFFVNGAWGANQLQGVAAAPAGGQFLQWDQAGSTPVQDVDAQSAAIASLTGRKPNTAVCTLPVFNALKNNSDVRDRFKFTSGGSVTRDMLAGLFEVDRFLVAESVTNTALEGAADATDFILGKHFLLAHVAPRPGLRTPSAGYTFTWTGLTGSANNGTRIKRFRMEELESDRIEIDAAYDFKKVGEDLAFLFLDAAA